MSVTIPLPSVFMRQTSLAILPVKKIFAVKIYPPSRVCNADVALPSPYACIQSISPDGFVLMSCAVQYPSQSGQYLAAIMYPPSDVCWTELPMVASTPPYVLVQSVSPEELVL